MIPETAKDELIKKRLAGDTWTSLVKWVNSELGISVHRTTLQRWYDKEVCIETANPEDIELDTVDDRIKLDRKAATYKAEMTHYKKLYENSLKETTQEESILEAITKLTIPFAGQKPYVKKVPVGSTKGSTPQTVVAPLCDTHIGEHVDYEEMVGLNSYNFDIFNKRLYGWASQLLTLVELRRQFVPIEKLTIPMLGDMISGDIHDELIKTNLDNCLQQMIRGASLISQALMYLAPHFKKVEVSCVVGNHGRMARKPPMKNKYMDWDYMLYQWVAAFCKEQSNITFHIPKSYMSIIEVCNRNILIMHGDNIAGGGSITSVTRLLTSLRSIVQFRKGLEDEIERLNGTSSKRLPTTFDSVMMGHFHRCDELDIGTGQALICGCMKGGDEFALQRLGVITKPQQIVTYWHPKYGMIGKETIYLNRYDRTKSNFTDTLSEIWINNSFSVV
jgi:hypothetical protein